MKTLSLALFLMLSTCAMEPAFAEHGHEVRPMQWYAVFVWETRKGMHVIVPASVNGMNMPQAFNTRSRCELATAAVASNLNEKYGGYGKPTVHVLCIAARNKMELRQNLRRMDLNFGGQPV